MNRYTRVTTTTIVAPPTSRNPGPARLFRPLSFWQRHPAGWNMVLCDGSARLINFSIDATTHLHLGNRRDGYVIDAKQW